MRTPECPCGSRRRLRDCCGPLLDNTRAAVTCEELMRSRYTAYVVGNADHLFRTWHPRTRPDLTDLPPSTWTGLQVLGTEAGGPDDQTGIVEFVAHHRDGVLHERSEFTRRAGRWVYFRAQ